jgi:pre-mRNA-processing factor 40
MIENDDRYKAMLGQPGSTPMDLFWDVVEEEERALRGTRNDVLDVIDVSHGAASSWTQYANAVQDKRFEVTLKTTFPEFEAVVRSDRRTANIEGYALQLIFERVSLTYVFVLKNLADWRPTASREKVVETD